MDKNQNRMSSIYWKPRAEDIIQELWAALLISVLTALGGVLFYIYYQPFNKLMLAIGIVIFFVFILYFIYLFLSRRELLKIKSIIHKELGSSQLSLADLRKSISNICNILGIDKCTLYAQDKSNSDLILFFEHNTKIEYMRGLVRRSETSYQIWVKKVPWFTRNPAESDASKASAFRDREKIINSMAFPLKNGKVFGIVFFNYITQKKFFQYSGELKWIQRWGIIGNNPSSRYKEILEYFVDNLSFHLDLQRNLVDSPLTQVRKLSFFDRLYEILKSERYTDVLARHLLSGLVSNLGRLHCAIYLKKDTNTQVDSSLNINYEIVDSNVNFSQSLNFKKNYNFENVPNSKGILEHIHSIGGGAPFVCVTSHPGGVVEKMQLQLKKIFPNDVEAFMIFPIYGTDFKLYNKQNYDKGCFSRSQEKEEIPKGYIVVRGSSSIERFDDYTPMAFSLMSDYIGLILDNINSQNSKRLFEDVIVGLKNFEKHLNKKSNSWKEEVAPLLKLALHISGAQQADLWVYRSKIDKFYMAAAESSNTVIKLSDAVLQPRPNGNTFEIMRSGQNFFWPNTEGQNSLKPGANAESGIKALMGYPIEGLMNSFGVIWLRWDKKQEIEHFKEISKDLDVLFQYSGYLLSVSQPINEIEEISDKILSGARIILEPVLAKDLPASADYEEAVLLIKPPNTFNRQTIIEILRVAKENGCEFHGVRVFSGSELSDKVNNEKSRIEKHLGKAYNIAKGNEHITQIERVEINRVYNIDRDKFYKRWDCYPEDMDIIPALSLDISEEKITSYWEEGRDRERFHKPVFNGLNKIGESKSVLPIKEAGLNNGKPFFLLNGYLPGYKLLYTNKTSKTIAILLRWENNREQQELKKWRRLRESVFGDKNHPDECFPNSIRWRAKNETNFPIENRESVNGQKNIVHFSVSPLEAINDLNTWFDIKSEDTIYGRKLSSNPIDYELILDSQYETFLEHYKLEFEAIKPRLYELCFWEDYKYQLKSIWKFDTLIELFSDRERRYLLKEFYYWKDILFDGKTEYHQLATNIVNKIHARYQHIPAFKETLSTLSIEHLKKCLSTLFEEFKIQNWNEGINNEHFVIVMAINCWLSDQIEINNGFIDKHGFKNRLLDNLEKLLPRLSERLVSYSKSAESVFLDQSIKSVQNNLALGEMPEYKEFVILKDLAANLGKETTIAFILAAGRGTRLKTTIPKGMLLLDEKKTIISRIVESLKSAGIKKIFIVIQENDIAFFDYINDLNNYLGGIIPIRMGECPGVGFRISVLLNQLKRNGFNGNILISYSDIPFIKAESVSKLLTAAQRYDFALAITQKETLSGQIKFNNPYKASIEAIEQARYNREIKSDYQDGGFYAFKLNPSILEALEKITPDIRGDYVFADIVKQLYIKNAKLSGEYEKIIGVTINSEETLGIDVPSDLLSGRIRQYGENELNGKSVGQIKYFESRGDSYLRELSVDIRETVLKEYRQQAHRFNGPAELFTID